MSYNPHAFHTDEQPTNVPAGEEKAIYLENIRNLAKEAHEQTRLKMAARQNYPWTPFKEGDKVWLDSRNLPLHYASRKLSQKRQGPFLITKKLSNTTYELKLPLTWKIHNHFHASLLTRVVETPQYGKHHVEPPPELVAGEEEYEIEAILNHRTRRTKKEYLIRWKGYSPTEDSWEPEKGLSHSKRILNAYKRAHKLS